MDLRSHLELHYTQQRERLYAILGSTEQLSIEALDFLMASFRQVTDMSELGMHYWAMMRKTDVRFGLLLYFSISVCVDFLALLNLLQGVEYGVPGLQFKVYMQYLYFFLVHRSQRSIERVRCLDFSELVRFSHGITNKIASNISSSISTVCFCRLFSLA